MKFGRVVAAAVLLTPIPFIGIAEPAAAARTHTVSIEGTLVVGNGGHAREFLDIDARVNLTHTSPIRHPQFEICANDEARGVLLFTLTLNRFDEVGVTPVLYLYEGSSCGTRDLDATASAERRLIPLGGNRTWSMVAKNDEFLSFDVAQADFTVTQGVGIDEGQPTEPSHMVARRIHLLCIPRVPCHKTDEAKVEWVDEANNETGYEVRRTRIDAAGNISTEQPVRLPSNATTFTSVDLDRNSKYCYQVRAVGTGGRSDFTPVSPTAECV